MGWNGGSHFINQKSCLLAVCSPLDISVGFLAPERLKSPYGSADQAMVGPDLPKQHITNPTAHVPASSLQHEFPAPLGQRQCTAVNLQQHPAWMLSLLQPRTPSVWAKHPHSPSTDSVMISGSLGLAANMLRAPCCCPQKPK